MRFASLAAISSIALFGCSSVNTNGSSGGSDTGGWKASGSSTGAVVGTITNAPGEAEANNAGAGAVFSMTLSAGFGQQFVVTTPSPSTIDNGQLTCALQFDSVPGTGTYTSGSTEFSCFIEYMLTDNSTTAMYSASAGSSPIGTVSLTIDSITKTLSEAGTDFYAVTGSLDLTLSGGILTPSGSTPGTATVNLTF